jgi:hypothetical protein
MKVGGQMTLDLLIELFSYLFVALVYVIFGKIVVDDLYIDNQKIRILLILFWVPFVLFCVATVITDMIIAFFRKN